MDITDKIDEAIEEGKGAEGFDADYTTALKKWRKVDIELMSMEDALERADDKSLVKRIKKMRDEIKSISVEIKKKM